VGKNEEQLVVTRILLLLYGNPWEPITPEWSIEVIQ